MEREQGKHFITGNTFSVKDQLKELGCKWDGDAALWYHSDPKIAAKAQDLVPAGPLRHVIGQAPFALKDQLKELGAKWDSEKNHWYHTDKDVAVRARSLVAEARGRHYLTGNSHDIKDQLKALGCKWDGELKQWYHTEKEVAARAQAVVDKTIAAKAQDLVTNRAEKHYIPEVPYKLNEQLKQMGCRWDAEARSWFHTDPEIGRQANQLVQETREKLQGHESKLNKSEIASTIAGEIDHGL